MSRARGPTLVALVALAACGTAPASTTPAASSVATPIVSASPVVLVADITAAPGLAGDPEASCRGFVTITLDPTPRPPLNLATARFELSVSGCPAGTRLVGGHIHRGQEGEILVDARLERLDLPGGSGSTTTSNAAASPRVIGDIAADPAAFIFNWHSERHPAGGFRGQLRRR